MNTCAIKRRYLSGSGILRGGFCAKKPAATNILPAAHPQMKYIHQPNAHTMKNIFRLAAVISCFQIGIAAQAGYLKTEQQCIEIIVYHCKSAEQLAITEEYLQNAWMPALHGEGVKNIGVFKPVGNDTAADKRIYVLVPYASLKDFERTQEKLEKNKTLSEHGKAYANVAHNMAAYSRMERILLKAFADAPQLKVPALTGAKQDRVYELRSYESASEKLFRNKVEMFNAGGEIKLFDRLGFNAVFYGEVIAGAHMPNLMYMTSFENKLARDRHWSAFGADPEWKRLSSLPQYQNNVSHIDITFLTPTSYSDL